jgi:hypothetical protein
MLRAMADGALMGFAISGLIGVGFTVGIKLGEANCKERCKKYCKEKCNKYCNENYKEKINNS